MSVSAIDKLDLRPAKYRPVPTGNAYPVARTAGAYKGTLNNWLVSRLNRQAEHQERETIVARAQDIFANDPHGASIIDSHAFNVAGTGLIPQSRPNTRVLGWSEDQGREFQSQAEWAFTIWAKEADAKGRLPFWAIQLLSVYAMAINGEFLRIPVMLDKANRTFSIALQCVDPLRISTPSDKTTDKNIRDGVVLDRLGAPKAYYVANPNDEFYGSRLSSSQYRLVPASVGHRPGAFHVFMQKEDEQVRGVSILAPAMKFFRDLSDYLDYELVGAIIAASFPVFVEVSDPAGFVENLPRPGLPGEQPKKEETHHFTEVPPGQMIYGNKNEKPHVLKNDRPGDNFGQFVERILRAVGASAGLPYEVVAKDFSKTNYSSARAALLEAWRVFAVYQKWLVDMFCQPVWEMVLEEAWLRDMITLPKGSPDWYAARHAYTRATWIPPKRGHVDPLKEISAFALAKDHNMMTLAHIAAIMGEDWETLLAQRAIEKTFEREKKIEPAASNKANSTGGDTEKKAQEDDDA